MNSIEIENLTRHYGRRMGIEDVSLTIREGGIFGFLGPNGAGKTTTIRILLGLIKAGRGQARIFGRDCWHDSARIKHEVGYLPDDVRLYAWMTVRQALKVVGEVRKRNLLPAGLALAERFHLQVDLKISRMSRGNKQKAGLVLAMAHQPRLLILDEPTTALDPLVQETLFACLTEAAVAGHTIFFSSHTLSEVERLCDEVAILKEGRLVITTTLESLRRQAGRKVTIHWQPGSGPQPENLPPGLCWQQTDGLVWSGILQGNAVEVARWCATRPVADLTIEDPGLTEVFQRFYQDGNHD